MVQEVSRVTMKGKSLKSLAKNKPMQKTFRCLFNFKNDKVKLKNDKNQLYKNQSFNLAKAKLEKNKWKKNKVQVQFDKHTRCIGI